MWCDNIIETLLNVPGKTKDGVKSRLNLVEMGIRAPEQKEKNMYLPPVCYTLSRKKKIEFFQCLAGIKSQAITHQIFEVSYQ